MGMSMSWHQVACKNQLLEAVPLAAAGGWRASRVWLALSLSALLAVSWTAGQAQTVPAPKERTVNEWLSRMHEASRERAYTGTLVVSTGSSMSASRIWHICDGRQQMERIDTLNGAPRTTIRRNNEVITFAPDVKRAWVETRDSLGLFPELLRTPANAIPDFYEAHETGVERVAGYAADVVEIVPKDAWRFGYRIWSEQKTGLVLKLQTLSDQGVVLEQLAFSELQLNAPVRMEKLRRQMKDTRGYEVLRPVLTKTTAEAQGWQMKETVPGFQAMSCHTRATENTGASEVQPMQCVFSDGLASISMFVEPLDPQRHSAESRTLIGATHSLSRRVGTHWVTVLGEVPTATLDRFMQALERTR